MNIKRERASTWSAGMGGGDRRKLNEREVDLGKREKPSRWDRYIEMAKILYMHPDGRREGFEAYVAVRMVQYPGIALEDFAEGRVGGKPLIS